MKLLVVSSSPIIKKENNYSAYSPYVKELKIWQKYSDSIAFTCPVWEGENGLLVSDINFSIYKIYKIKEFNIKTFKSTYYAFKYSFMNLFLLYKSMVWADHIHLRCPGNIGLLGCLVQIFFPNKPKTAKYAGNWDPNSKQPLSYKFQKWILSNTILTKNIKVLVYGDWKGQSAHIKSFFTATYQESEKILLENKALKNEMKFVFVGGLTEGKQPIYAVQLIQSLIKKHKNISLSIYGNGILMDDLKKYINEHSLSNYIFLKGNQTLETVKKAYIESHFVILPSKSEGWPKVIAEGMFWKCLPIATPVSCVPHMLDNGNRGILLSHNLDEDVVKIESVISDEELYNQKSQLAMNWSRKYTIDYFEQEIEKLLIKQDSFQNK
jgi:glycosyltransferase involved in cell wall biosynthesis